MRSKRSALLVVTLLAPLFISSAVLAVDSPAATTQTDTKVQLLTAEQKTKLQERLNKRKTQLQLKLTQVEEKRLQARCKNSQSKLNALQGRIAGIQTSRTTVYTKLVDRLTTLDSKLVTQGVDTAELKAEITTLKQHIADFNANFATYQEAVGDLAAMDCVADPAAFKASLEAARSSLDKVRASSVTIKQYVTDTIKPTLKKIHDNLAADKQGAN